MSCTHKSTILSLIDRTTPLMSSLKNIYSKRHFSSAKFSKRTYFPWKNFLSIQILLILSIFFGRNFSQLTENHYLYKLFDVSNIFQYIAISGVSDINESFESDYLHYMK